MMTIERERQYLQHAVAEATAAMPHNVEIIFDGKHERSLAIVTRNANDVDVYQFVAGSDDDTYRFVEIYDDAKIINIPIRVMDEPDPTPLHTYDIVTHDNEYMEANTHTVDDTMSAISHALSVFSEILYRDARDAFKNGNGFTFDYRVKYEFECDEGQETFQIALYDDDDNAESAKPLIDVTPTK